MPLKARQSRPIRNLSTARGAHLLSPSSHRAQFRGAGGDYGSRRAGGVSALEPVAAPRRLSHNGFAEKFDQHTNGFFRKVISQSKVNGPIVVTHTANDRAVGIAYPLASRISADNRSALGDENDVTGASGEMVRSR
jgi:hypothetical protein